MENRAGAIRAAGATALLGVVLALLPQAQGFVHWSFDLPTVLRPTVIPQEILLLQIDQATLDHLRASYKDFNRTNHANLLQKLSAAPARLVVFDIFFADSEPHPEDSILAQAITNNGRVVLASEYSQLPGYAIGQASRPLEAFANGAINWGVTCVTKDADLIVRAQDPGSESCASLAWAAAEALGAPSTKDPEARATKRWLRYYGDGGTLPSKPYQLALSLPPETFRDKVVFVGGKPMTRLLNEVSEVHATPYTHWDGKLMAGLEIQATTFLNLWRDDWLTRISPGTELLLLLCSGVVLGLGLALVRPIEGLGWAAVVTTGVAVAACLLFWFARWWFSWLLIAGAQVPCAWLCATLWHMQRLHRERDVLEEKLAGMKVGAALLAPSPGESGPRAVSATVPITPASGPGTAGQRLPPEIPDHVLLRRIGKGAYGEVYLARNAIGLYHAVKVVYRDGFIQDEPYEREFRGIQKYMPVSLHHPGLVPLLHVGRNDANGYFYYVMELGDDKSGRGDIRPETYSARNLAEDLARRDHLPVAECVEMLLSLTEALHYLHSEKLVHRDIKPSNIIFIKGVPKFADIGLVTDIGGTGRDVSYVGTFGYIAPEGPGQATADIYSLGVVAYQMATGLDRSHFPELPETLTQRPDLPDLLFFNRIVLKACQPEAEQRYPSAAEMHTALLALQRQIQRPSGQNAPP